MWDIILAPIIGAAIPIIIQYIQTKEKQKYFELERKEKFKLVAIEKRIEAHQQALKYWELLRSIIHKTDEDVEKQKIIKEVNKFWLDYSLYLEKETRLKFKEATWIVSFYKLWVDNYRDLEQCEKKKKKNILWLDGQTFIKFLK